MLLAAFPLTPNSWKYMGAYSTPCLLLLWYRNTRTSVDILVLKHQAISKRCRYDIHCIGLVSYQNITFKVNTIWNCIWKKMQLLNTLRPKQNNRHFADDIFKCIFLNENVWISINISLKFIPKFLIDNISSLVQIMAWRRPGDKPLFELMMIILLTHICVTRPQWIKGEKNQCHYFFNNSGH